jgi:hypothetical protein
MNDKILLDILSYLSLLSSTIGLVWAIVSHITVIKQARKDIEEAIDLATQDLPEP